MQELTMNQTKNSFSGVTVHPIPLFASSWVALFCLLRSSLVNYQAKSESDTEQREAGDINTKH
jgi:hypothetical protein